LARAAGIGSGAIIPLIATRFHDLAIDVAGLLGVVGFATTLTAFGSHAGKAFTTVAAFALLTALANFAVWQTGIGLAALPVIQRAAFAFFLVWVVMLALRLRRQLIVPSGARF
jgi:hypothetical protein